MSCRGRGTLGHVREGGSELGIGVVILQSNSFTSKPAEFGGDSGEPAPDFSRGIALGLEYFTKGTGG